MTNELKFEKYSSLFSSNSNKNQSKYSHNFIEDYKKIIHPGPVLNIVTMPFNNDIIATNTQHKYIYFYGIWTFKQNVNMINKLIPKIKKKLKLKLRKFFFVFFIV